MGSVLAELVASGEIRRDEIVVISKIGYIQGQNLKLAEAKEQSGRPYPELVKYGDGIWHCIHPEFLADQLTLSLDRLGLATLDICLLHNPEYFFLDAAHRGNTDLEKLRTDFYARSNVLLSILKPRSRQGDFNITACHPIPSPPLPITRTRLRLRG